MLNEPVFYGMGNLASDPELRYTNSGIPVATFSLAMNPRVRGASGEWEDGTTVFIRITAWRDLAENVTESLRRGDPALVVGKFRQRTWTDETTDTQRRADEVMADTVAVPLDRRIVRATKVTRERGEASDASGGSPETAGNAPGSSGDVPADEASVSRLPAAQDAPGPRKRARQRAAS
jgi:single-strand DNA-binding protein